MGINAELIKKYKNTPSLISDFYKLKDKYGKLTTLDGIINPLKIDNRQLMSPTDNQGELPACAGFSAATLLESIIWQKTGILRQLNSEQVYARAKQIDGDVDAEGTYLEKALQSVLELAGLEKSGIKIGLSFNDNTYRSVETVKYLIHRYGFMQIGFNIDDGWYRCTADNYILKCGTTNLGGHAVNICGYSDEGFYILNQWGTEFGAKGYCIMPYDLFLHQYMYCAYLYNLPEDLEVKFQ